MSFPSRLLALVAGASVLACSSASTDPPSARQSSCDVETRALEASFSVQARGDTTQVFAALLSDKSVELGCGDLLVATVGGRRVELAREADPGEGPLHYVATLPSPPGATEAILALERPPPKVSAPMSATTLPAAFALRDLRTTVKVSSGEDPSFRIDPPIPVDVKETSPRSVQVRVELEGPCLERLRFVWSKAGVLFPPRLDADGTVTVVGSAKFMKRVGDAPACDVELRVATLTAGTLDGAFAGPVDVYPLEGSRHETATVHLEW